MKANAHGNEPRMRAGLRDRVTVITPTYNRAEFLPAAVESVLSQSEPNFEYLIVDDGSTDDTREVVAAYQGDGRVRYLHQKNQGQARARNHGLEQATGEFIAFLDSDNVWCEGKLARQLEILRSHAEYDVVYGDIIKIDRSGDEISRQNIDRYSGWITPQLLRDNCVSMNTAMARHAALRRIGGFNERRGVADDYDLWLRLSLGSRFLYVPEYFAKYRVMPDQISGDKRRRFAANEAIVKEFARDARGEVSEASLRAALADLELRKARYFASRGMRGEAAKAAVKAAAGRPWSWGQWRGVVRLFVRICVPSDRTLARSHAASRDGEK